MSCSFDVGCHCARCGRTKHKIYEAAKALIKLNPDGTISDDQRSCKILVAGVGDENLLTISTSNEVSAPKRRKRSIQYGADS